MMGITGTIIALLGVYLYLLPDLPSTEDLQEIASQVPLRVYSKQGDLIAAFGEQRRIPITYDQAPERMVQALLAAEDDRFFYHPGVDYQGIIRAGVMLLLTGEKQQGGSTITMQVARNFFLSREKTFRRKLSEIMLALQIESKLSKQEILEIYFNRIYLGNRTYGIEAAAEVYYGKPVSELTLAQTAMIAGLPKAPSRDNPVSNPKRAVQRRAYVLGRMLDLDFITEEEYKAAMETPVSAKIHATKAEVEAPYLAEMVRAEMVERYGEEAYTQGLRVITTLDGKLQTTANLAVRRALQEYDERHGYRGAEENFDLSTYNNEDKWDELVEARKRVGDLVPALILDVKEKKATAYLGNDERQTLEWDEIKWARRHINTDALGNKPQKAADILKPGDMVRIIKRTKEDGTTAWRLAQIPAVEGALVSVLPDSGAIAALVGGYDYQRSKFNRATQAKRQPGSGFKAFIYSAALEAGFTAASLVNDAPVVVDDAGLEDAWRPENYSGEFFGPTRLRLALTKSRNMVSIRLLRSMGMDHALKHIGLFGFDPEKLPRNLSLALGSGAVTPLQMAAGYSILANGGFRVKPYFIERIEDSQNKILYQAAPLRVCADCEQSAEVETPLSTEDGAEVTAAKETETSSKDKPGPETTDEASKAAAKVAEQHIAPRVITPQNWYLMNSMMRDVITHGTATRAKSLGRKDLAGKTGTTNDQRDAWFNGFHRTMVAVAWVGFDSSEPLGRGEVGGRAALPAWITYMEQALKGVEEQALEMPPDMVTVRIDPKTGQRVSSDHKGAITEAFRTKQIPKRGGMASSAPSDNDLF
jgi:penicillin-binding protein 1A